MRRPREGNALGAGTGRDKKLSRSGEPTNSCNNDYWIFEKRMGFYFCNSLLYMELNRPYYLYLGGSVMYTFGIKV